MGKNQIKKKGMDLKQEGETREGQRDETETERKKKKEREMKASMTFKCHFPQAMGLP